MLLVNLPPAVPGTTYVWNLGFPVVGFWQVGLFALGASTRHRGSAHSASLRTARVDLLRLCALKLSPPIFFKRGSLYFPVSPVLGLAFFGTVFGLDPGVPRLQVRQVVAVSQWSLLKSFYFLVAARVSRTPKGLWEPSEGAEALFQLLRNMFLFFPCWIDLSPDISYFVQGASQMEELEVLGHIPPQKKTCIHGLDPPGGLSENSWGRFSPRNMRRSGTLFNKSGGSNKSSPFAVL